MHTVVASRHLPRGALSTTGKGGGGKVQPKEVPAEAGWRSRSEFQGGWQGGDTHMACAWARVG